VYLKSLSKPVTAENMYAVNQNQMCFLLQFSSCYSWAGAKSVTWFCVMLYSSKACQKCKLKGKMISFPK